MRLGKALVLITTSFPIKGDGSEAAGSFVSDLAEELGKHQELRVVAPGKECVKQRWSEGVEVFRFAAPQQPLSTLKPWRLKDLLITRRVLASGEAATRAAAFAGPVAHILALWALPSGHWARKVSREARVPYSVWTLGSDIWTLGSIPILKHYLALVLKRATYCYSDGYQLATDTAAIGQRKVDFLPSTRKINTTRITELKSSPPYRLLFIGRWHANKGIDILLEALLKLSDDDWEKIELVQICGGGPLEKHVEESVSSLSSGGLPIQLRGYVDQPTAEQLLQLTDYVLIPSRIESIPVVFSDAIKSACPVIVTPVGDFPRIFEDDPKCGLISKSTGSADFRCVISEALNQSPAEFKGGLAQVSKRFDLTSIAAELARRCINERA